MKLSSLAARALGLAALAFALGGARPAAAAEKIVFLTSWFAQAEHGGFYQAQATGLYKKAGLEVEIRQGGPQINGMQLLLAGEVDAVMGYDFQVLQAVEKGLPAVTVGTSFQSDLQGMMTHDDVKSLADLKGKTILLGAASRLSWWPWMKQKFGTTDDQTKPYTFNLQPFFADPNTAQQAYPGSEPFQAQQKGVAAKFFLFADNGYPPYGSTIVVTRDTLAKRKAAIRAFVTASVEGWRDYMKNPGPGNALIKEANPKMADDQIAFGIEKMKELKVLDGGGAAPVGSMTEARWKGNYDYLVEAGLLKASTDWRQAFTLDLVKDLTDKAE